jgi:hypothetical protein
MKKPKKYEIKIFEQLYNEELNKIKQLPQTQTSLMKQCEILIIFANKLGLYDSADFLRNGR